MTKKDCIFVLHLSLQRVGTVLKTDMAEIELRQSTGNFGYFYETTTIITRNLSMVFKLHHPSVALSTYALIKRITNNIAKVYVRSFTWYNVWRTVAQNMFKQFMASDGSQLSNSDKVLEQLIEFSCASSK